MSCISGTTGRAWTCQGPCCFFSSCRCQLPDSSDSACQTCLRECLRECVCIWTDCDSPHTNAASSTGSAIWDGLRRELCQRLQTLPVAADSHLAYCRLLHASQTTSQEQGAQAQVQAQPPQCIAVIQAWSARPIPCNVMGPVGENGKCRGACYTTFAQVFIGVNQSHIRSTSGHVLDAVTR